MAKAKAAAAIPGLVTASIMAVDTISGNVELLEGGAVKVLYKKPRSPKMITRILPAGNYIAATEGEEGSVTVLDMTEVVSVEVEDINASVEYSEDGRTMTITDVDGEVTVVDTTVAGLTIAVEGEPQDAEDKPAAKGKGKAKAEEEKPAAKAKGKGKAKAEEPEEPEEEDEDEDEEEEEKPAKKGKGKAKAEEEAPKGKKKKGGDDDW